MNGKLTIEVVSCKIQRFMYFLCGCVHGVRAAALPHRIVLLGFSSPTGSQFEFDDVLKQIQNKPMDLDLRSEGYPALSFSGSGVRDIIDNKSDIDTNTYMHKLLIAFLRVAACLFKTS